MDLMNTKKKLYQILGTKILKKHHGKVSKLQRRLKFLYEMSCIARWPFTVFFKISGSCPFNIYCICFCIHESIPESYAYPNPLWNGILISVKLSPDSKRNTASFLLSVCWTLVFRKSIQFEQKLKCLCPLKVFFLIKPQFS